MIQFFQNIADWFRSFDFRQTTPVKRYKITSIESCYSLDILASYPKNNFQKLDGRPIDTFDDLKPSIFLYYVYNGLSYDQSKANLYGIQLENNYVYNVIVSEVNEENEIIDNTEIRDTLCGHILLNGLTILPSGRNDITYHNKWMNTLFLQSFSEPAAQAYYNIKYEPVDGTLFYDWWKYKIATKLSTISTIRDVSRVTDYCKVTFIDKTQSSPEWNVCILKQDLRKNINENNDTYKQKVYQLKIGQNLGKELGITSSSYQGPIGTQQITDDSIKNEISSGIEYIYRSRLGLRPRYPEVGNYQVEECEDLGFLITQPTTLPQNQCYYMDAYLAENTLQKISPTADICKSNQPNMRYICACYGSLIIPYGVRDKRTLTPSGSNLYRTTQEFLGIEAEHIAHFLQMMFFGGSSSVGWTNKLCVPIQNQYIVDGLVQLKELRSLFYDISIELYNQWKYNQELLIFTVTEENSQILIQVDYNSKLLDTILGQVYLGKKCTSVSQRGGAPTRNYPRKKGNKNTKSNKNTKRISLKIPKSLTILEEYRINNSETKLKLEDWNNYSNELRQTLPTVAQKQKTKNSNLLFHLKQNKKMKAIGYDMNGDVQLEDLNKKTILTMFLKKRKNIHDLMKQRIQKINSIYRTTDCKKLLLITCQVFSNMLETMVTSSSSIKQPHLDFLQYAFLDTLQDEINKTVGGGGYGNSSIMKGGQLNEPRLLTNKQIIHYYNVIYQELSKFDMNDLEKLWIFLYQNEIPLPSYGANPDYNHGLSKIIPMDMSSKVSQPTQEVSQQSLTPIPTQPTQEVSQQSLTPIPTQPTQERYTPVQSKELSQDVIDKFTQQIPSTPRSQTGYRYLTTRT